MMPDASAGSNQTGANDTWMPQVSCPPAAAQAGNAGAAARPRLAAARTSRRVMTNAPSDDAPRRSFMPFLPCAFVLGRAMRECMRLRRRSSPHSKVQRKGRPGGTPGSGALRLRRGFRGVAQRVAETAYGLDVILAARVRQLPAKLVHKDAQLELGFVLIPVEVIEEHLLREHRSLAHAEQF